VAIRLRVSAATQKKIAALMSRFGMTITSTEKTYG
jgi:hypothetical protein